MLVRFRQELKRCHGARALIYSLQESKTGFTGTTASGAKRPFVEYAIYVVHGTKQRRPIVRHVIGGALHISRKLSRENLQGSPRHCRHSGDVIPCSHRIATISA
jgi:hypothetical protein